LFIVKNIQWKLHSLSADLQKQDKQGVLGQIKNGLFPVTCPQKDDFVGFD